LNGFNRARGSWHPLWEQAGSTIFFSFVFGYRFYQIPREKPTKERRFGLGGITKSLQANL
jgi:hypothetical protein